MRTQCVYSDEQCCEQHTLQSGSSQSCSAATLQQLIAAWRTAQHCISTVQAPFKSRHALHGPASYESLRRASSGAAAPHLQTLNYNM
jgi:hypothetical protein